MKTAAELAGSAPFGMSVKKGGLCDGRAAPCKELSVIDAAAELNVDETDGKLRVVDIMGTAGDSGRVNADGDNDDNDDVATEDALLEDDTVAEGETRAFLNAKVRDLGKVGGGGGGAEVSSNNDKISVTLQKYFHDEFSTIFGRNLSALALTSP